MVPFTITSLNLNLHRCTLPSNHLSLRITDRVWSFFLLAGLLSLCVGFYCTNSNVCISSVPNSCFKSSDLQSLVSNDFSHPVANQSSPIEPVVRRIDELPNSLHSSLSVIPKLSVNLRVLSFAQSQMDTFRNPTLLQLGSLLRT